MVFCFQWQCPFGSFESKGLFSINKNLEVFLYFKNKPQKRNIGELMFFPYARIIPMHLTIIFGGIFLFSGIASTFVLILFLGLKTVADLVMHFIEHKEQLFIKVVSKTATA